MWSSCSSYDGLLLLFLAQGRVHSCHVWVRTPRRAVRGSRADPPASPGPWSPSLLRSLGRRRLCWFSRLLPVRLVSHHLDQCQGGFFLHFLPVLQFQFEFSVVRAVRRGPALFFHVWFSSFLSPICRRGCLVPIECPRLPCQVLADRACVGLFPGSRFCSALIFVRCLAALPCFVV